MRYALITAWLIIFAGLVGLCILMYILYPIYLSQSDIDSLENMATNNNHNYAPQTQVASDVFDEVYSDDDVEMITYA